MGLSRAVLMWCWMPVASVQLAGWLGVRRSWVRKVVGRLAGDGLLVCLNPGARHFRLFFPSREGLVEQARLREEAGLSVLDHDFPQVDWELYGLCLYPHRKAVVLAMDGALQAAAIRRLAVRASPGLAFSSSNARDALYWLAERGVVRRAPVHGKVHVHYRLSSTGVAIQRLVRLSGGVPEELRSWNGRRRSGLLCSDE